LADAEAFWAADSQGYYGVDMDGKLVGSGSIVSYEGKLGFCGLFMVRPEWRWKGLGPRLADFLIERIKERLEPGASAALDGVFAKQDYYAKSGFAFQHRNLRMEGVGEAGPIAPDLVELHAVPFEELAAFDRDHFGADRSAFLKRWLTPAGGLGVGYVREGRLAGCGVVRPCVRGFKIGPLFAEDLEMAESIFAALSNRAAGQPLFLDTPEVNTAALELASRHGMKECFGCARMVMGPPPPILWERVFGVTTFELG
jgi:GNAT superfamily N-acetyltransferase